jgi:hypothetical protein
MREMRGPQKSATGRMFSDFCPIAQKLHSSGISIAQAFEIVGA